MNLVDWNQAATGGMHAEGEQSKDFLFIQGLRGTGLTQSSSEEGLMFKYEGHKFDDIGLSKSLRRKHALVRPIGVWLVIIISALFFLYRIVEFVRRMFDT